MKQRIALLLGTWFGCGHVPRMPGTAGSIGALPLYFALARGGAAAVLTGACATTALAIACAEEIARSSGEKDPQHVVIDEVAGMLVALAPCAGEWPWALFGCAAFRVFDTWKPWPARTFERRLPGGWGIVLDDVAAGAWAAALVIAARSIRRHV